MLEQFLGHIPRPLMAKIDELHIDVPSSNCREDIRQLLSRSVLVGGKRLRPLLTAMMGEFFNNKWEDVATLARIVELVHASSLAHDDVVDNASLRRGIPSINALASNKQAVLAGDYLLADVIDHLAQLKHHELMIETARVIKQLALGEWVQIDAAKNRTYSHDILEKIARHKTASVISWCTSANAIWMRLPAQVISLSHQFGENLGLAFQYIDDTLDFSENSKKDLLLDLKNGQVNGVVYEWLVATPLQFEAYKNGQDLQELWSQKELEAAISIVRKRALVHLEKAREILPILHQEAACVSQRNYKDRTKSLQWLMQYLEQRGH